MELGTYTWNGNHRFHARRYTARCHVETSGCHVETSGCHVRSPVFFCRVETSGRHVETSGRHVTSPGFLLQTACHIKENIQKG